MNWFTVGAAVILVFFVLNYLVLRRFRTKQPSPATAVRGPVLQKSFSGRGAIGMLAMTAVWLACLGAPVVAPGSALGLAMSNPWTLLSVVPWSMLVAAAFGVAEVLLRRRRAVKAA